MAMPLAPIASQNTRMLGIHRGLGGRQHGAGGGDQFLGEL